MRAAVISAPGEVDVREVDDPSPGADEVVVAVHAAGICGTDLHILDGEYAPSLPIIPGHEFAGSVVARGDGVVGIQVGDLVAVDPNIPCETCRYCRQGRVNLCENYSAVGVTRPGAAAELVAAPAGVCVVLDPGTDPVLAALAEPLACAMHAMDLVGPITGQTMLVIGAGTMGLMTAVLGREAGVGAVDVVDMRSSKLEAAALVGDGRVGRDVRDFGEGERWDVVVDATGVTAAIVDGLARVQRGGTFLQLGVATPDAMVSVSPYRIYDDELRIVGSVCPADRFPSAVRLVESGALRRDIFVTDVFGLDEYALALRRFAGGETRKVVIAPA